MSRWVVFFLAFILANCAGFKDFFATPQYSQPISCTSKLDAFALTAKFIDSLGIGLEQFNFANGFIKSDYIQFNTGLATNARTKLVFQYNPEKNILDIFGMETLVSRVQNEGDPIYVRDNILKDYHAPKCANVAIESIKSCAIDSTCLDGARKQFISNFTYNYLILKTLTEVGREKFQKEHYLDNTYAWALPLQDLIFNKDKSIPFKYIALFNVAIRDKSIYENLLGSSIYIKLYTNNEKLVDLVKQERVEATGVLKTIDNSYLGDTFNFTFEDK